MQRLPSTMTGCVLIGYHAVAAGTVLGRFSSLDVSGVAQASSLVGGHLIVIVLALLGLIALLRGSGQAASGEGLLAASLLAAVVVLLPASDAPLTLAGYALLGLVLVFFDRLVHVPPDEDDDAAFEQAVALIALATAKSARQGHETKTTDR